MFEKVLHAYDKSVSECFDIMCKHIHSDGPSLLLYVTQDCGEQMYKDMISYKQKHELDWIITRTAYSVCIEP